jgi:anti-anti-sigma factor
VERRRTLEVRIERIGATVVLELHGRLTVEAGPGGLRGLACWIATFCGGFVLVDLGNLLQLDCSGIGQLVELRNEVCRSAGAFAVANVTPREKRLLQHLGLFSVLHVFDSRRDALSWFREAAAQRRVILIHTARAAGGGQVPLGSKWSLNLPMSDSSTGTTG